MNNFFAGSNSATTTRKTLYTGLNVFTVLGVNPTKELIEQWTGAPYKLNVDYSIITLNEKRVRPVDVWVASTDGNIIENVRFFIGTSDDINTNGTVRYVNSVGDFCQGKVDPKENPKMAWFTAKPYRVAKQGEHELFTFMMTLMRYNSRDSQADFLNDATKNGITVENIYNNNIQGLTQFFNWCSENENMIVLLAAVRRSRKVAEDGSEKFYDNQVIVSNPEYFYRTSKNEVSNYVIGKLGEAIEKGRRVSNSFFTILFEDFDEKKCINKVPDENVSPSTTFGSFLSN